jgi:hypothetical protein
VNDTEVIKLWVPAGTFKRIVGMKIDKGALEPFCCLVDQEDENMNIVSDKPLYLEAHQGLWLVKVFFGQPKKYWKRIKQPDPLADDS